MYVIMKTMCPPTYHLNGFVANTNKKILTSKSFKQPRVAYSCFLDATKKCENKNLS